MQRSQSDASAWGNHMPDDVIRDGEQAPRAASDEPKPFPRLGLLKAMQGEAEDLIAARKKAILIHNVKNIDAAGRKVETSVRGVLRARLPSKYYLGQGHIVSPMLHTSPQFDAIIADTSSFPLLFKDESGTEWFPHESVYAVGEIKSSYDKSKRYIEKFCDNVRRTKTTLHWPKRNLTVRAFHNHGVQSQNQVSLEQLFKFMVFVDSSEFRTADVESLYKSTPPEHLPNVIYFVDKGVLLSMKFGGVAGDYPMEMNLYPEIADKIGLVENKSKWCLRLFAEDDKSIGLGMAFLTFYYLLMGHLGGCTLEPPSLLAYYSLAQSEMGPRSYLDVLE